MDMNGNMPTNMIDHIFCCDCLEGMKQIPDGTIDAVICDLPYGTIQGTALNWRRPDDDKCLWDEVIPSDKLFVEYERVLRRNGTIVLFSQVPYTNHLRTIEPRNIEYLYPMYWKKEHAGNILLAKSAPVNYIEDINVYRKKVTLVGNHPLREYFAKVIRFLDVPKTAVTRKLGTRAQHCFNVEGNQFSLCTAETYADIIEHYHIDKMEGFVPYDELKRIDREFKDGYIDPDPVIFNLPEGEKSLSNVLEFPKEFENIHPTQKPVDLIRRLVLTYTNEGDTVLDNCSGSGTTAVAAWREKRHFVCFEKDPVYWEKSVKRLKNEMMQQRLF